MGGDGSPGSGNGFFGWRAGGGQERRRDVCARGVGSDNQALAGKNRWVRSAGECAGGRLRNWESCGKSRRPGSDLARSGGYHVSDHEFSRILESPGALGENGAIVPAGVVCGTAGHTRVAVGSGWRSGFEFGDWRRFLFWRVSGVAVAGGVDGGSLGTARRIGAEEIVDAAAARRGPFCGVGGKLLFQSGCVGWNGIPAERER